MLSVKFDLIWTSGLRGVDFFYVPANHKPESSMPLFVKGLTEMFHVKQCSFWSSSFRLDDLASPIGTKMTKLCKGPPIDVSCKAWFHTA